MANEGKSIEEQIDGVFTVLENRLAAAGLGLDNVVKMDCLFKDINDLNVIP
ncbi:MAG: Rid family hydrolase [Oscillospiraceae bacterium]|nr:Rid family hydrolase [Oscillospiraceae bacterium]